MTVENVFILEKIYGLTMFANVERLLLMLLLILLYSVILIGISLSQCSCS